VKCGGEAFMNVLVLNCGSSSVKFQLIEISMQAIKDGNERLMAKGGIEKIGEETSIQKLKCEGKDPYKVVSPVPTHGDAIQKITDLLTDPVHGIIKDKSEINAVGHRMVHGAETFTHSCLITEAVLDKIKECIPLAPLHNPHNIKGYEISKGLLGDTPHVAVFDTAFHQTMPPSSYIYALPYELYTKNRIRRYGFHGTSHRYVARSACRILGKKKEDFNVITVHIGNGASIAAVKNGSVIDTSMGFTPLEGLVMGTRCGDLDPAILMYLMEKENMDVAALNRILNKKSGLLGITGISNDMRVLEKEAENGNERAILAEDIFAYRIKKYIGAYTVAMGGVDIIVFTAGIGENSPVIRAKSCDGLQSIGAVIDPLKNDKLFGAEGIFSTDDSPVKLCVIPTNEELVIAHDTVEAVEKHINGKDLV
jgi:acetate kinase